MAEHRSYPKQLSLIFRKRKSPSPKRIFTCAYCGKPFERIPSEVKFKRMFCSRKCSGASCSIPIEERFWSKVQKTDSCWIWTAGARNGYGRIRFGTRIVMATHVSWFLATGCWPQNDVLHTCDNPPCVRPDHLFPGTDADNTVDKITKRRHAAGMRHPRAKLSEADVLEIRRRLAAGEFHRKIADDYGIDPSNVTRIATGENWKSL